MRRHIGEHLNCGLLLIANIRPKPYLQNNAEVALLVEAGKPTVVEPIPGQSDKLFLATIYICLHLFTSRYS